MFVARLCEQAGSTWWYVALTSSLIHISSEMYYSHSDVSGGGHREVRSAPDEGSVLVCSSKVRGT